MQKKYLFPIAALALMFLVFATPTLAKRSSTSAPVISSFFASPNSIAAGQNTTLSWSVSDATTLSINQGVGIVYKTTKIISPTNTTIYTLTATNSIGSATATTSVSVTSPLPTPTCSLQANPASILVGSSATLTFSSTNATGGVIDHGIGAVGASGSKTVSPTSTTLYVGAFTGAGGSVTCSAQVNVTQPQGSGEIFISAYTTSYSYWDNTPIGSTAISYPVLHQGAGGVGTYADPITLAVGHSIINGVDILDYPAGTRFYIPNVRRYFIVEDTCGDGSQPQNGPCHIGYPTGTSAWVDMWVDGQSGTQTAVQACENFLTDTNGVAHTIIENPATNYVVVPGALFQNGSCTAEYGNTPVIN